MTLIRTPGVPQQSEHTRAESEGRREEEGRRQIEPIRRRKFASAQRFAPSVSEPGEQAQALPRLHPALLDVEMQETRAIAPVPRDGGPENHAIRQPEVVNGSVILYRQSNFSVRTVYLPGQKIDPLRRPSGQTAKTPKIMPHQSERVAVSETRRMPQVDVEIIRRTRTLPVPLWLEALALLLILAGALALHAFNLFRFPAYDLDEGTYMQNAWTITQGKISPYAYGYGHPPVGWMQIALWIRLTGLFTFGNALNSGRVLMLAYAAVSALMVYLIARRLGGSQSTALLGVVAFAFSPLSVTFQREVLLDNIATCWLLVSLYLLVASRSRLPYLLGAALALGLAVLSKEVLAICLPAMSYAAWLHTTPFQRKFALVAFTYVSVAMISTFVLMALLKGEFFPYAWHLPWDTHPHLSMLDTFIGQVRRGQSLGSFRDGWNYWLQNDRVLTLAGLAAPAFNLIYGWWNRKHLMLALLALSYWLLLARGGQVFPFYVIPLLPLIALNAALALHTLLGWLSRLVHVRPVRALLLVLVLCALLPYDLSHALPQLAANPTSASREALVWMREHLPRGAEIIISTDMYLDLRLPGGEGVDDGSPFLNAEVYVNAATDPTIRDGILHNDWRRIDYVVVDATMLRDLHSQNPDYNLIRQALDHATLLASFQTQDAARATGIQIFQVQHMILI